MMGDHTRRDEEDARSESHIEAPPLSPSPTVMSLGTAPQRITPLAQTLQPAQAGFVAFIESP